MTITIKKEHSLLEFSILFYVFAIAFSTSSGALFVKLSRILVAAMLFLELHNKEYSLKLRVTYFIWSILFFLWGCLSCAWAVSQVHVIQNISTHFYIVFVDCIIVYVLYNNPQFLFSIMKVLIWGAVAHGLRIFLTYGFSAYFTTRGGGDMPNANTVTNVTCYAAILAYVITSLKQTRHLKLYYAVGLALVVFTILTASKKIFLVWGVVIVVWLLFQARNPVEFLRNFIIVIFVGFVGVYLIFNLPFLYNLIGARIESMIVGLLRGNGDGSTDFRINLLKWGWEWFSDRPFLGYGMDCFKYLLGSTYDTWAGETGVHAHNNYMELLVDVGLIGTLLYYSLYFITIFRSFKMACRNNKISIISLALIISLMVVEMTQTSYSYAYMQLIIIAAWFMASELSRKGINW